MEKTNASYLGSYGNAVNTVIFPLTVIALAIAVMIGDGCCAFVSISLGRGETARARQSVDNSAVLVLVSSLLLTAVYLGADNESAYYTQFAIRAFRIYLCMMIFACVNKACFIFLLLPPFFGLDGVLYSMPVSDILTFPVAIFLIHGTYKQLRSER